MRKLSIICLVVLFSFLLLTACEKQNIKIGYAGCLTGTNSELGVSGMYGAMLAVEDINSAGGIKEQKLELVAKDDKGDKSAALKSDRELQKEGCIAIIGHMTSDMAELTVPFINENKILMISPTIALPSLSDRDDYFFRLIPTTKDQAERIAGKIIEQGTRKVQIVYSDQNKVFASFVNESLISSLDAHHIQTEMIGAMKAEADGADYDKNIKLITDSDADALVIIASSDIVTEIAQSLRQTDWHKTVYLPAWAMTNDLIKRGGPSVEGFYGVNFVDFESKTEKYLAFRSKYIKKYGDEPTFASVLSYESVFVLADAMKASESYDADALKESIDTEKQYNGLQGPLLFNNFGDIGRDIYLYQIRAGKFVKAE